tara:strand:+ start:10283 stop:12325 length:2043 start_codon:yes stop_codon:yes gene_type:complete
MSHDINKPKILNAGAVFMLNLNNLSIFAFLVFLLSACNPAQKGSEGHTHLIKSNYGHLKTVKESHLTPAFLINHNPTDTYDVCLSERMESNFPGIKEEIKASINIWGYYIGRKIDVNIITRQLPVPDTSWSLEDRHQIFKQKCPKGVELIVGEDIEKSTSIAYTHIDSKPWFDGRKWIAKSFTRILMFRTITADGFRNQKFFTLSQLTGQEHSEEEITSVLKRRDTKLFSPAFGKVPMVITMLHEIGHVWGLCDMYHLDRGSNCDPDHSEHRGMKGVAVEEESIMYSSKSVVPFYLRDDDLNGIKALDQRFNNDPKIKYTNIEVPREVPQEKNAYWSEIVNLNKIDFTDTNVEAFIDLETNGDKDLTFQYKYSESARWQTVSQYSFYDKTRLTNYSFKFRYRSYVKQAEAIRIVLLSRNGLDLPIEIMRKDSKNGLQLHDLKESEFLTVKALLNLKKKKPTSTIDEGEEDESEDKPEEENENIEDEDEEDIPSIEVQLEEGGDKEDAEGNETDKEKEASESDDKEKKEETSVLPPKVMGDNEEEKEEEKKPDTEEKPTDEPIVLPPKIMENDPPKDDESKKKSKIEITVIDDDSDSKKIITLDDILPPKSEEKKKEERKEAEKKEEKPVQDEKELDKEKDEKPEPVSTPSPIKDDKKEKAKEKDGVDLVEFLKSLQTGNN